MKKLLIAALAAITMTGAFAQDRDRDDRRDYRPNIERRADRFNVPDRVIRRHFYRDGVHYIVVTKQSCVWARRGECQKWEVVSRRTIRRHY